MSEGLSEGFFQHYKNKSKRQSFDTKKIFNIQRFLVLISTGGVLSYTLGWISIPFIISQVFMFRYFHRIIFNHTISKLEKNNNLSEDDQDNPILKVMDKEKTPMVLLGVSLQIFIYLFLM